MFGSSQGNTIKYGKRQVAIEFNDATGLPEAVIGLERFAATEFTPAGIVTAVQAVTQKVGSDELARVTVEREAERVRQERLNAIADARLLLGS